MVSLTQLGIANQNLVMAVLHLRYKRPRIVVEHMQATLASTTGLERKPPPEYEEFQMIAAIRQRNLRKRAKALGVEFSTTAAIGNHENFLHYSPSTYSLPAELAGDRFEGREEDVSDIDFGRLLITSTLVDDGMSDRHVRQGISTASVLGERDPDGEWDRTEADG
jgi:hypothetical protein